MKTVFIYGLVDPITNIIRYIGKTNNLNNRYKGHISEHRSKISTHKINWIKSLHKLNLKPSIIVIDEVAENEWQFWESHYISLYKSWGFILTNLTSGGDGCGSGPLCPHYGKKGIHNHNYGKKHSNETKNKMKLNHSGINNPFYNKKHSAENLKKISQASQGKNNCNYGGKLHNEEYITKQINSNSKKPLKITNLLTNEIHICKNSKEAGLLLNYRPNAIRGKKPKIILKKYLIEFL